jgi:hypothetical protein
MQSLSGCHYPTVGPTHPKTPLWGVYSTSSIETGRRHVSARACSHPTKARFAVTFRLCPDSVFVSHCPGVDLHANLLYITDNINVYMTGGCAQRTGHSTPAPATEGEMKGRGLTIAVSMITVLLMGVGIAGATPLRQPPSPAAVAATVAGAISYQGRLANASGAPLNGTYTMRFVVYNAAVAGTALWDSGNLSVAVDNGLFNVHLGVDQAAFNGQALWLSIIVNGETLSPRQEILPAPYALSVRPGARIVGDAIAASGATLAGYAPATGTALYGDAGGGVGLIGSSIGNYGVHGTSTESWGGYFTSSGGYGIRVQSSGTDHYDHGAYVTSQSGYGVYAQSATNQGVRGEAGNVAGIAQPLGAVGVVGIGANRGTYGSSSAGIGVYGVSSSNYGVWGQSTNFRGVTGRTSRTDNNYGFYTPDNLFSLNVQMAGALMQVMQNGGAEPLSPGDVVVFSGINRAVTSVDGPIVRVSLATEANSTAVAGVVFSRFNLDAVDPERVDTDGRPLLDASSLEVTPAGSAPPDGYVLVVVQGLARVRSSALGTSSIEPGDLLSTGDAGGVAARAAMLAVDGVEVALPGTVFGKALESASDADGMIYVYVTLQ